MSTIFAQTLISADCGGTQYFSSLSDTISIPSPGYPGSYATDVDCEWTIIGPSGHYLSVTFEENDLPWGSNCSLIDHLELRDGNRTGDLIADVCGSTREIQIDSSFNVVVIKFKPLETSSRSPQVNHKFLLSVNASEDSCGGNLEGPFGTIKSPGFPNSYPHNVRCDYKITGPPGRLIKLTFEDFDLSDMTEFERNDGTTREFCDRDRVMVRSYI